MFRNLLFFTFLIQAALGDGNLFTILEGESTDGIKDCDSPEILSCKKIQVNFEALDEEEGDEITLEPLNVTLGHMTISDDTEDSISYSFINEKEDEATFTLTNDGTELTGDINLPSSNRSFEIANCGSGCHVLIEEDMVSINNATTEPLVHPEESRMPRTPEELALVRKGALNRQCVAEVTLTVYLTPQFMATTSNPGAFVANAVAVANAGFQNSGVQIRLKLHCVRTTTINDAYSFSNLIYTFSTSQGGYPFNNLRRSADMAMLLTGSSGSACGIAYVNTFSSGLTTSVVAKNCVAGYTFAHELGHNFGAYHDIGQGVNPNYSYGHGSLITLNGQPSGYRSIMSYYNTGYETRVNFWSFNGFVGSYRMGSSTADNARLLNLNRFAMASVGNEAMSC